MKRYLTIFTALLSLVASTLAGFGSEPYRVSCTLRGSGKRVTVLAESSPEARRVVADMFPDAVVTGALRIKK